MRKIIHWCGLVLFLSSVLVSAGELKLTSGQSVSYDRLTHSSKGVQVYSPSGVKSYSYAQIVPSSLPESIRAYQEKRVVGYIGKLVGLYKSGQFQEARARFAKLKPYLGYVSQENRQSPTFQHFANPSEAVVAQEKEVHRLRAELESLKKKRDSAAGLLAVRKMWIKDESKRPILEPKPTFEPSNEVKGLLNYEAGQYPYNNYNAAKSMITAVHSAKIMEDVQDILGKIKAAEDRIDLHLTAPNRTEARPREQAPLLAQLSIEIKAWAEKVKPIDDAEVMKLVREAQGQLSQADRALQAVLQQTSNAELKLLKLVEQSIGKGNGQAPSAVALSKPQNPFSTQTTKWLRKNLEIGKDRHGYYNRKTGAYLSDKEMASDWFKRQLSINAELERRLGPGKF